MTRCKWLAVLLMLVVPGLARAQAYPTHYITLIVPLAAGTGTDTVARLVAAKLGEALGTQIIVENKVGANGAIGAAAAARAAPDGYTLLIGGVTTHASNPNLMKSISYNPVKDFAPIEQLGVYPYALLVSGKSPYQTLGEMVAAAKGQPGVLSFAYANALGQLSGEMLKRRASVDINAVPYRSSPQAITDIIGGRVTMMFVDTPPAVAQIEAKTLRAVAVTTERRTALLPDVPTMAEAGFEGPRVEAWTGLFAPAKTPAPIIAKLSASLVTVLAQPGIKTQLAAMGFEVQPASAQDLGARVASDVALWAVLTKEAGLEPQ
jgi:tripartite-type tricarboxylate transporter receptor subunit TctC